MAVTYSASGSCVTTAEGSLTFQHAGTCSVTASQDASTDYEAAVARTSIEVVPAPQVIDVTSGTPSDIAVGDTYLPSADGGASGEPVVFGVDETSSGVCSISDGLVTLDGIAPAPP